MGRKKGTKQTGDPRRFRPKHLRGGRKPGAQPDRQRTTKERRKPNPRSRPQSTDQLENEALKRGDSIISAKTLERPVFLVITKHGKVVETLDERVYDRLRKE